MLSEKLLNEIREVCQKASPAPWTLAYDDIYEPTDDPELLAEGITEIPVGWKNIQLKCAGTHRFWLELTERSQGIVWDFDLITGAREWIPELLAEIERLRGILGKSGRQDSQ